jgi:uncharacterized membrane protein YfcA
MIESLALLLAGVLAGTASAAGAIGSLITYPALLAVGIGPLAANIAQSVAVVGTGAGAVLGSRPELGGTGRRLARWGVVAAVAGLGGIALLLLTTDTVFRWAVPFLVAAGAVALLLQPRITAWRTRRRRVTGGPGFAAGLTLVSVYNGYFGAGSGIMTLALLLVTVEPDLRKANALKNALLAIGDVLGAVALIIFASVRWSAVVPLGVGLLCGGLLGPRVIRHLPERLVRIAVALAGLALAAWLLGQALEGASE